MTGELELDLAPELRIPVLASLARRGSADLAILVDHVAATLERSLPHAVRVERRGWFRRRRVEHVTVVIDDVQYDLHHADGHVRASTRSVRNGMLRRTRQHSCDEWVHKLVDHLAATVRRADEDRRALTQLATAV